ncbi:hypothetical protein BDR04DRAFT_1228786 [Suillus decipiens]|nr:hypothetical protein BDR04DRAFT_1228786 [Suillus decipiens]
MPSRLPPMTGSFKPAEEHLPSLLAYDTLPGHQDFDSIISDSKFTADSTDFYNRSLTTRRYALVGVACSIIFSCSCIVAGIVTLANKGVWGVTVFNLDYQDAAQLRLRVEIFILTLNLIVALCTESTGFVHGISLRSALASESRLRFNTNLRLLTAARGWFNPNGALLNGISAVLLIISYSSVSLVPQIDIDTTSLQTSQYEDGVAIAGLPILILGVSLLLQVIIALSGIRAVKILTWSSSPFDLTAALIHHAQLTPAPLRCMRSVSDADTVGGPTNPLEIQPSAWNAHPSIRKVVISLWILVAACGGWAALVIHIWNTYPSTCLSSTTSLPLKTWSFIPNGPSNCIAYDFPGSNLGVWILLCVNVAAVQGPLTLGLHCSELIANVTRDEIQWRYATGRKGLRVATNPVKMIFTHPICLILFAAKPFLHWMFGLSFHTFEIATDGELSRPFVFMYTAQMWNLCFALLIFACFFTFVSLRRPRGPQPAAYGHVQTLANLVDEWSPVMWWGHKEDGIPYCHAGTSDYPLPDVKMDRVYSGFDVGSDTPSRERQGTTLVGLASIDGAHNQPHR